MKRNPAILPLPICAFLTGVAGTAAGVRGQAQTVVPFGSDWHFLDDGSDQGTPWREVAFDDDGWNSGPAQLGYGDGDEATVVSFGADPDNKFVTTYFRHTFAMTAAETTAWLRLVRDDGAIVYVNGIEVFRSNMPVGGVDYLTLASSSIGGDEEDEVHESFVDGSMLNVGKNVIAVEIHQRSLTSSDISFDLELLVGDVPVSVSRGPYLQRGTADEVVVRWRTIVPAESRVTYGLSQGNLNMVEDDPAVGFEHEIELSGLMPNTKYFYAVGTANDVLAGDDNDHFFVTSPPIGTTTPTRIWVLGDSGTADSNAEAVRDAYHAFNDVHTNLWLMLGDNAYSDGTDIEYQDAVFDMYPLTLQQSVLWPTLGNHDGHSADSATQTGPYYDIFTLPTQAEAGGLASGTEAYYSFDYGNIHFICLNSYDIDRDPDGAMMMWLESDLADTLADWIIAFWHHPPYSMGSHNSDTDGRMTDMRMYVLPTLEAGGVDLVLTGHSHSYERSFLINGHYQASGTLYEPTMILDAGDGREDGDGVYRKIGGAPVPNDGAVYIVAGSSGKTGGGTLDHPVMFVSLAELGSLVLDIDGIRLDARFLQSDGQVTDYFAMDKLGQPPVPALSDWSIAILTLLILTIGSMVVSKQVRRASIAQV